MTDASEGTTAAGKLIVACPVDGTLNAVPRGRLGDGPSCGKCGSALFQGTPIDLTAANYGAHVLRSDIPAVIDVWAEWCGPCRQMAPAFEAAARRLEPRARLVKLNSESEQGLAARFAIRGIPTLIMMYKGREIDRSSGARPADAIVDWVQQALAKTLNL